MDNSKLTEISSLKTQINHALEIRGEPQTVSEHLSHRALSDLFDRLNKIENILSMETYDLVFIGQVGVGKTTAICYLFQLIMESQKKKKIGKQEREVEIVEPLMTTGAGFTTLCEVTINKGSSTFFEIEPYPAEEVCNMIDDFCWSIWLRIHPDQSKDQTDQGTLPPEYIRAIRNMVDLPEKVIRGKETFDTAKKLASSFDEANYSAFKEDVVSKANISHRVRTEIKPNEDEPDIRKWIKDTFGALNLVRISDVSIPHKITINVKKELMSDISDKIARIIDTKGVDAGQFNRQDLDTYIRDNDNAICLFAESFLHAPSSVIDIIERHMTKEAKDISSKIALFVMPRENQPDQVVGPEGPVGDRDEGIARRVSQIEEIFAGRGIDFQRTNIVMYDPLEHYEPIGSDYKKGQYSEQKDIDEAQMNVLIEIEDLIKRREDQLIDEVQEKKYIFEEIQAGRGLDSVEDQLVKDAVPKIREYSQLDFANADRFFDEYRRPWIDKSRHVMTLRATNNRFGYYLPRDINIYYDAKPVVEKLIKPVVTRRKDKILDIVKNITEGASETSELQRLMSLLVDRINSCYESYIHELAVKMQNYLLQTAFYPEDSSNEFWINVQDRYGKGPGYRDDVLSMYEEQMNNYELFLQKHAESLWKEIVIDKAIDFIE